MAMVSADDSSQSFGGLTAQIGWFGLRVGGHPALSLHSSNEPGELSQWVCHIVVVIIIIIIIIEICAQNMNFVGYCMLEPWVQMQSYVFFSGYSVKLEVGERYIQVWAPDNGRMPFPSIITVWGGGMLLAINRRWGNGVSLHPITL